MLHVAVMLCERISMEFATVSSRVMMIDDIASVQDQMYFEILGASSKKYMGPQ
jgi:hypothetical protein